MNAAPSSLKRKTMWPAALAVCGLAAALVGMTAGGAIASLGSTLVPRSEVSPPGPALELAGKNHVETGAGTKSPKRGSSAELYGGSSADRYGGNSADTTGVAGRRDSRVFGKGKAIKKDPAKPAKPAPVKPNGDEQDKDPEEER